MLAAQFYTVREFTGTRDGFRDALRRVAEMGYPAVQLSAIGCMNSGDVSAAEARSMLDEFGLQCVATHRPWEALRDDTDAEIAFHQTLGCPYTAIGGLWSGYEITPKDYRRWLGEAIPVAERLLAAGIRFGYHNHAHEFIRDPESGKCPIDVIVEEGGPIELEVDTYWVQHAGMDPVRLLERVPGRITAVHIKDKEVVPGDGPVMSPVGEGNMDWPRIIDALRAGGTQYYIVEQDDTRRDPFDCLRSSLEYLKGLGL